MAKNLKTLRKFGKNSQNFTEKRRFFGKTLRNTPEKGQNSTENFQKLYGDGMKILSPSLSP